MAKASEGGRGPGRPKVYKGTAEGAPQLTVRLNPPVYEHIKAQPEGSRAYLERVVTEDMERTKADHGDGN